MTPTDRPGYGPDSYVSWHNFADDRALDGIDYLVHDTTLRDGEQQAGVLYTTDEKIAIAAALDELGVDRIEAGMVVVSQDDRDAIRRIVDLGLNAEIWTIVRSIPDEVDHAVAAGVDGTGVIMLANEQYCEVFRWDVPTALVNAMQTAKRARAAGLQTTLLVADSTRMDLDRLEQIVDGATSSGVFGAIALMDTFGVLSPAGARHLVSTVRGMTDLPIELHPHNDFGLGTANAFAGLEAGASVIHTSMLGLGERLGNTPLEQFAAAAPLLYGAPSRIDLSKLTAAAELVRRSVRIEVAPNAPVIGAAYSMIESGVVASEFQRWTTAGHDMQWLIPFDPRLIGAPEVQLVLGKGSGLANIADAVVRCGLEVSEDGQRELVQATKDEAIRLHRLLTDDEFAALARAVTARSGGEGR
jgi:isopropylmalate/homocitrate/citramalate synthase